MKSKNSHVVINTKTNMMECQRCGDTHSMKTLEGARLDVAVEMMRGFERVHAKCRVQIWQCTRPGGCGWKGERKALVANPSGMMCCPECGASGGLQK